MTTETLPRSISETPSRPFKIHTADIREDFVRHPDFIAHAPNVRTVVEIQSDESFEMSDRLRIDGLRVGKSGTANPRENP